MLVDNKKLLQYIHNEFNVLFVGERGVGKTATIYSIFNKENLRVKYFSAPTMDPWTDLVGVPTTVKRRDGKEVLRMIPPEDFADDNYDVIFIDELNRAPPKVLDALLELIQFKTINGKKYSIKMIWAAMNPYKEDNEYNVEPLEKALEDRFQIKIHVPYVVDRDYFKETLGSIGLIFADWWSNQPEDIKKEISPRRLHEGAKFYLNDGDYKDIINHGNTSKLDEMLKSNSDMLILEEDFKNKKIQKSLKILNKDYSKSVEKYFTSKYEIFEFFLPHLNNEWVASQFTQKTNVYSYLLKAQDNNDELISKKAKETIKQIINVNPTSSFVVSNAKDFSEYISEGRLEKIEDKKQKFQEQKINKTELQIVKIVLDNIMDVNGTNITNATSYSRRFTQFAMRGILLNLIRFKEKHNIPEETIVNTLAFNFAIAFKIYRESNKLTSKVFNKVYNELTSQSSRSYLWGYNPNEFLKQIGSKIKECEVELESLPLTEVKELYLDKLSSKMKKRQSI